MKPLKSKNDNFGHGKRKLKRRSNEESLAHFVAGGFGGVVGAFATSPLEVIKTRLQSSATYMPTHTALAYCKPSLNTIELLHPSDGGRHFLESATARNIFHTDAYFCHSGSRATMGRVFWEIFFNEGIQGFFRGLAPQLVGIVPSRAITLGSNAYMKSLLNDKYPAFTNSVSVQACSASVAGFVTHSLTNPIWLVKTRLQLDKKLGDNRLTVSRCCEQIYKRHGLRGFWQGVTGSYLGIPEITIMLVLYEDMKRRGQQYQFWQEHSALGFMLFSATSKLLANFLTYPHEVIRTRLREGNSKYNRLIRTIQLVAREEGMMGLYGGFGCQMLRQFPNTMITFLCYEYAVKWWQQARGIEF